MPSCTNWHWGANAWATINGEIVISTTLGCTRKGATKHSCKWYLHLCNVSPSSCPSESKVMHYTSFYKYDCFQMCNAYNSWIWVFNVHCVTWECLFQYMNSRLSKCLLQQSNKWSFPPQLTSNAKKLLFICAPTYRCTKLHPKEI